MTRRFFLLSFASAIVALLVTASAVFAALAAVHGYAAAVVVDVTPSGGERIESGTPGAGPLGATGGSDSNGGLSACIPSPDCAVIETGERGAFMAGEVQGDAFVSGGASARDFSAFGGLVTGSLAGADCAVDAAGVATGTVRLADVTVNGVAIPTDPAAGTTVVLLDSGGAAAGHVIFNEQLVDAAANRLTVNAIHIALDEPGGSLGSGDVLLAHVECGSTLATEAPGDTTAPWTSRPSVQIVENSLLGSRVLGRITWRAGDEGSGIARYRVQQRINRGSWATINSTITTPALSRFFRVKPTTYQLRVQAFDKAGNASAWVEGPIVSFSVLQESNRRIDYRGSWRWARQPGALGGGAMQTRIPGASATVTFRSRAFAVIAPTGPGYHSIAVRVDGVRVATVDLRSSKQQSRTVVYSTSWAAWSEHTVEITVFGAEANRRVALDAVVLGG